MSLSSNNIDEASDDEVVAYSETALHSLPRAMNTVYPFICSRLSGIAIWRLRVDPATNQDSYCTIRLCQRKINIQIQVKDCEISILRSGCC